MPKINVYLPERLATAVRTAGVPVSPICQKALSDAVRAATVARKTVAAIRDPSLDRDRLTQVAAGLDDRMTARLREVLRLAGQVAGAPADIETKHLLIGVLTEGENLAVRLLHAAEVDTDELRDTACATASAEPHVVAPHNGDAESTPSDNPHDEEPPWTRLTMAARAAVGAALEAALELGHNYLGCEHLLLGLLADPGSGAGQALHSLGVESAPLRRAVAAAVAGFAHARQAVPQPRPTNTDDLVARLDAIELRLSAAGI